MVEKKKDGRDKFDDSGCGCNGMGCTPPNTFSREAVWRRWWAKHKK